MLFFWRNKHNIFRPKSNNFYIYLKSLQTICSVLWAVIQWSRSRWTMASPRRVTRTTTTTMTTTTRGTGAGTRNPGLRSQDSALFPQRWTQSLMLWHRYWEIIFEMTVNNRHIFPQKQIDHIYFLPKIFTIMIRKQKVFLKKDYI